MFNEPEEFLIWHAGEMAPAGTYVRVDDRSYRRVTLSEEGLLPASFDGHVALYRALASISAPGITRNAPAAWRSPRPLISKGEGA